MCTIYQMTDVRFNIRLAIAMDFLISGFLPVQSWMFHRNLYMWVDQTTRRRRHKAQVPHPACRCILAASVVQLRIDEYDNSATVYF